MLSEEALILVVAATACALLAVGVFRLIRPPVRRDPERRPRRAAASTATSTPTENAVKKVRPGAQVMPLPEPGDSSRSSAPDARG